MGACRGVWGLARGVWGQVALDWTGEPGARKPAESLWPWSRRKKRRRGLGCQLTGHQLMDLPARK